MEAARYSNPKHRDFTALIEHTGNVHRNAIVISTWVSLDLSVPFLSFIIRLQPLVSLNNLLRRALEQLSLNVEAVEGRFLSVPDRCSWVFLCSRGSGAHMIQRRRRDCDRRMRHTYMALSQAKKGQKISQSVDRFLMKVMAFACGRSVGSPSVQGLQ